MSLKYQTKLLRRLPKNRTYDQVLNHYKVEKELADRLKRSTCEERKIIYETMYEELFSKVPDHPRLTRRKDDDLTRLANKYKLSSVRKFIDQSSIFLEFAPGDCRFAFEIAKHVRFIYGVDISDQRNQTDGQPANFKLIVYDGYNLDIEDDSIDVVFSNQLIEHFHPDDTKLHFKLVNRVLKKGGVYIFSTPHSFSGPHDVSKYFSNKAEGFHLKEWTYAELYRMSKDSNYSRFYGLLSRRGWVFKPPFISLIFIEKLLGILPNNFKKNLARLFIPNINAIAIKEF